MNEYNVSTHLENGRRKLDRKSFDYTYTEEDIGDDKKETIRYIQWSLIILELMLVISLFGKICSLDLMPSRYRIAYIIIGVLFNVVMFLSFKVKILSAIMSILSVCLSIGCVIGLVSLFEIDSTIGKVTTDAIYETVQMSVLVPSKDSATDIKDLAGYDIGYVQSDEQVGELISKIDDNVSEEVNYSASSNFISLADSLLKGKEQAMLINSVYIDIINEVEGYTDFSNSVKVLYTLEVKVESEAKESEDNRIISDSDKFIIYLSGIDSYGSINVKSRSDVNILAVVNTEEGKIQLINTPRDYFVEFPISNGIQDKLTHAGIYGVKTSIGTLEELYDIKIDYFFRINFSGFEQIIDELGGIDVYSEYAFNGLSGSYNKGINSLSGQQALGFARERYAFSQGDIQRGNNQMAVIKAVVEKMTSTEFLKRYDKVMNELSGCFQTDMPSQVIYGLVRKQLANNTSWKIESLSVTGTGSTQKTFSMPTVSSYVMIPSTTDIKKAKRVIRSTLDK